jgi:peptidoglycan hydrolase-like protein with peptidoglycan-binding domain
MSKKALQFIIGAALLTSATPAVSWAGRPGTAQTSTPSTAAKKKKRGSSKSKGKAKVKGQMAPTPDRIREIQSALQKDGSYEGEPTGKWDATTIDAMQKYQQSDGKDRRSDAQQTRLGFRYRGQGRADAGCDFYRGAGRSTRKAVAI